MTSVSRSSRCLRRSLPQILLSAVAVSILTASSLSRVADAADSEDRPNVVIVMADDLGYECIGANGGASWSTPVLDELAETGVRFEHCYAQPLCTPTRVKLMTGQSNKRNYVHFGKLEESQTTFAQLFRSAGYSTAIVGKWQLGKRLTLPDHFGFDEHCLWQLTRLPSRYPNPGLEVNGEEIDFRSGEYGPDVVTDFACDFIHRHRDKPFLLYYPMILTHCPFEPTPNSADWDPRSPGSPTYKGKAKYFGDMVSYMDRIIGRLLAQLESSDVRDNTLFIFTGDNGTDVPIVSTLNGRQVAGSKGQMTDAGTRVPLIVHWPGHTPEGSDCSDLVDMSDFLPTICEAAGIQVPASLPIDGHSFLPQLQGRPGSPRHWIHCWYSRHGGLKGQEFTRNQRYKLYSTGKFYDIQQDVDEQHPLDVSRLSPELINVRAELQEALDSFQDVCPPEIARQGTKPRERKTKKKSSTTGKRKQKP